MLQIDDQPQLVSVSPRLEGPALRVVTTLAGVGPGPRRIWAGQPGARSPWLPCGGGCCLVLEPAPVALAADWLRFLVREVLAPEAAASVARASAAGLPRGVAHRLSGEVVVDDGERRRLLQAAGRRVRVVPLVDDLLPMPGHRGAGEVVDLARHLTTPQ